MFTLKNSKVVAGANLGGKLLEMAEATDDATITKLIELDFAHEAVVAEKLEADRELERAKAMVR